jgi:hypothetical protein
MIAGGFVLLRRDDSANRGVFPDRRRSNCLMFATLRADFSCVTITPYENPN